MTAYHMARFAGDQDLHESLVCDTTEEGQMVVYQERVEEFKDIFLNNRPLLLSHDKTEFQALLIRKEHPTLTEVRETNSKLHRGKAAFI